MDAWYHANSASKKWGGTPHDTLAIHEFIDSSKLTIGDVRHRAMFHHTLGVLLAVEKFGPTVVMGRTQVPVKQIAERHIIEDLGWLPTPADYLKEMPVHQWMSGSRRVRRPLSDLGLVAPRTPVPH
jgi:hypothetical protein